MEINQTLSTGVLLLGLGVLFAGLGSFFRGLGQFVRMDREETKENQASLNRKNNKA